MTGRIVIAGVQGALGAALAESYAAAGWDVRAYAEAAEPVVAREEIAEVLGGISVGSLVDRAAIRDAVRNADAVVLCPRLGAADQQRHVELVSPWAIECADADTPIWVTTGIWALGHGARPSPIPVGARGEPTGRLGALRAQAERSWRDEAERLPLQGGLIRLPRGIGAGALDPLLESVFRATLTGRAVQWPGSQDVRHEFLHPRDAAHALSLVIAQPQRFAEWHVGGMTPASGQEMRTIIASYSGQSRGGWLAWRALARRKFPAEWRELSYVFDEEILLDGRAFAKHTGFRPSMELGPAVNEALRALARRPRLDMSDFRRSESVDVGGAGRSGFDFW